MDCPPTLMYAGKCTPDLWHMKAGLIAVMGFRTQLIPILCSVLTCLFTCESQNNVQDDVLGTTEVSQPPRYVSLDIGTHVAGHNTTDDFEKLHDGAKIKIVWGFQGFNMAVFAVRMSDPNANHITVSIAFYVDDESIASLYYTDLKPNMVDQQTAWFFDLYMITPEVTPLVANTGKLSAIVWTDSGIQIANSAIMVGFEPPDDILP